MNKTYSVPSIHCQHCVHTIKMELSELEGVQNVDADLDSKKVSVTFDNPELEKKPFWKHWMKLDILLKARA